MLSNSTALASLCSIANLSPCNDFSVLLLQYFFDAAEAQSWLSEQELFMLGDDRGKDEEQVQKMLKKHHASETAIRDYKEIIDELANVAQGLVDQGHPER